MITCIGLMVGIYANTRLLNLVINDVKDLLDPNPKTALLQTKNQRHLTFASIGLSALAVCAITVSLGMLLFTDFQVSRM